MLCCRFCYTGFVKFDCPCCQRTGSLLQMVIRGDREEIMANVNAMEPLFAETITPSLEEIFIYEMGGEDYGVRDIML